MKEEENQENRKWNIIGQQKPAEILSRIYILGEGFDSQNNSDKYFKLLPYSGVHMTDKKNRQIHSAYLSITGKDRNHPILSISFFLQPKQRDGLENRLGVKSEALTVVIVVIPGKILTLY